MKTFPVIPLRVLSVAVMASLLMSCGPSGPLSGESSNAKSIPLPETYGVYVKQEGMWQAILKVGVLKMDKPEFLVFDRRISTMTGGIKDIIKLKPQRRISRIVEKISEGKDGPVTRFTTSSASFLVTDHTPIETLARPVEQDIDKVIVEPATVLESGSYILEVFDDKFSLEIATALPVKQPLHKWYHTIENEKGFRWSGFLAASQKELGEERTYNQRSILQITYQDESVVATLVKSLAGLVEARIQHHRVNEELSRPAHLDISEVLVTLAKLKSLNALEYADLEIQLVEIAAKKMERLIQGEEYPPALAFAGALESSGITDIRITDATRRITEIIRKREMEARAKVLAMVEDANQHGNELYAMTHVDGRFAKGDTYPVRITDRHMEYNSSGGLEQRKWLGAVTRITTDRSVSAWDGRVTYEATVYFNYMDRGRGDSSFSFLSEAERDKFVTALASARRAWEAVWTDARISTVDVFAEGWSEKVIIEGCSSFAFSLVNETLPVSYDVMTDNSSRYTTRIVPGKAVDIRAANWLQFRGVDNRQSFKVKVERLPFKMPATTVNAVPSVAPAEPGKEKVIPSKGPWLFPESSIRYLKREELSGASKDTLWRARNEIFVRNGYIFSTPRGKAYAKTLGSHYQGKEADQEKVFNRMNAFERANVELIKSLESMR